MTRFRARGLALAALLSIATAPALAAPTPAPGGSPHPVALPTPQLPTVPLHAEYVVKVNKKGQVVGVKSAKPSKVGTFNAQTFGNALQMWIREPNGDAIVGLYRVSYDYDPKTHHVHRGIALVSTGGSWANDKGAADAMIETAQREAAQQAKAHQQQQAQQSSKLPSLNQITGGKKTPAPSPSPLFSMHP